MAKRELHDVHAGQIWRDRDKRMLSGDRQVRVLKVIGNGDRVDVFYQPYCRGHIWESTFRSRYERFQRVFDFLRDAPARNTEAGAVTGSASVGAHQTRIVVVAREG